MKIALLGTRGIPARYGGFETVVEELGAGLAERGHDVVVYCRQPFASDNYRGMRRVVLPAVRRTALETLTHTLVSAGHALRHPPDAAVVFNAANAPAVRMLTAAGIPTALHVDGHDARRVKWRGAGQRYYSIATRWGAHIADRLIVDSQAVGNEIAQSHSRPSLFIPYGAKRTDFTTHELTSLLSPLGLEQGRYHLVVARFEPENQVLEIVDAYAASGASLPLALVGFAGYPGDYARRISERVESHDGVHGLGAVWDQRLLDALYSGSASYIHGHSVGGTNPSLLRAMAHEAPVIAFDCAYNRETTNHQAAWFNDGDALSRALEDVEARPEPFARRAAAARVRAESTYRWSSIVDAYDDLVHDLTGRPRAVTATVADEDREPPARLTV